MAVQWGNNSALAGFQNALAIGADIGGAIRQNRERSALADYLAPTQAGPAMGGQGIVATPEQQAESDRMRAMYPNAPQLATDPRDGAFNKLLQVNPELALKAQGVVASQAKIAQEQRAAQQKATMEQLPVVASLLDYASQGEKQWQEAMTQARRLRIDVSNVPQQFSPDWAKSQSQLYKVISQPGGQEALSTYGKVAADRGFKPGSKEFSDFVFQQWNADQMKTVAYEPGGGVAGVNAATGAVSTLIAPNTGGAPAGTPVSGSIPEGRTAVNPKTGERIQFKGGQWVPMGGGSGNATGGFPASGIGG